jgi:hypothetical protein
MRAAKNVHSFGCDPLMFTIRSAVKIVAKNVLYVVAWYITVFNAIGHDKYL